MLDHIPVFILYGAALAAQLLCVLGAHLLLRGTTLPPLPSSAAFLACFAFIPPGALAPWSSFFAGTAACGLLFLTGTLSCRTIKKDASSMPEAALALLCTLAALTAFAYIRGLPGHWLNLGTLAAMPSWHVAQTPQKIGLACLAAALAAYAHLCPQGLPRITFLAIGTALFVPFSATSAVGCGSTFVLFWALVCVSACLCGIPGAWCARAPRRMFFCAGLLLFMLPILVPSLFTK